MDQPIDSPEMRALLRLEDSQKEIASTMMAQIVEVQASLNVLIDLQKLAFTTGRLEHPELDSYCESQMEKYRKHCLEVLKQNVSVAKTLLLDNKGPVM